MTNIKDILIGKQILKAMKKKVAQMAGNDEQVNHMISEMINDMPLRSFAMLSNGDFPSEMSLNNNCIHSEYGYCIIICKVNCYYILNHACQYK
jgi:hypothetical protein